MSELFSLISLMYKKILTTLQRKVNHFYWYQSKKKKCTSRPTNIIHVYIGKIMTCTRSCFIQCNIIDAVKINNIYTCMCRVKKWVYCIPNNIHEL